MAWRLHATQPDCGLRRPAFGSGQIVPITDLVDIRAFQSRLDFPPDARPIDQNHGSEIGLKLNRIDFAAPNSAVTIVARRTNRRVVVDDVNPLPSSSKNIDGSIPPISGNQIDPTTGPRGQSTSPRNCRGNRRYVFATIKGAIVVRDAGCKKRRAKCQAHRSSACQVDR